MPRFYATPGEIPRRGEIWRPVGPKVTLMTAHLFEVSRVRPFVPAELQIETVIPSLTVGTILLSYYGAGSTLEYSELIIMPARVSYAGTAGFWVSHIYVDLDKAMLGGRRMGLPKEMAEFEWTDGLPGAARIRQPGRPICEIEYNAPTRTMRLPVQASVVSLCEDMVMCFSNHVTANFGLCRASVTVPPESPLAGFRIPRPLLAMAGTEMVGFMGENQKVLGFLPHRAV